MTEPVWLGLQLVIDIHAEQLALFGGPAGIRDQGMLESALGPPQNKFAYGEHDLAALAAAYAFGIARNPPFIDGNKRAALAAMIVFFNLNEIDLLVPQADMTAAILAVAAGEAEEEVLAQWLRDHLAQPKRSR
ncbi:MAG: type II toxin-antitoxin system death-on-curing family toxin [Beijerinckiaceae bacterium]|nr:type II toxin-antitoxin system death-on-curing family toxin [Beijerinckiaceae bacterium]